LHHCLLLCLTTFIVAGCASVKVSEIPSPFDDTLGFGEVITEIRIVGNEHTRESIILRALASKEGEVYTQETADLDNKWLFQLGVFTTIFFETQPSDGGVILVVNVTEVNPYIPAPSIKITEENGLEIGAALSSANLLGYASRLSVFARFGGATNLGFKFKDPWLPGSSWRTGYQIEYAHMERKNKVFDFQESSDQFRFIHEHNLTNWLRIVPQVYFLSVKSDQPGITLDSDNRDNLPGLGLSLRFDTRNLQNYPTQGWWVELQGGKMAGDADYWTGILDIRRYFPMARDRSSLSIYSLTTLRSGVVGEDVPIYQQFSIGGANSVRGWDLGSRIGQNQFLNTIEYWHMLVPYKKYEVWFLKQALGLQGAAFFDAGTAWNTSDQFSQHWIAGGGVGVRVLIPSNVMFRFDLAIGQPGLGFGINIGSQEKAAMQRERVR
jgi:outer membrane protein insertion porin family